MGPPRVDKCSITSDGVCAAHGVVIERRETDDKRLKDVEGHISSLLTFMNTLKGVAILAVIVIMGSYTYTYLHIESSDMYLERNMRILDSINDKVARFGTEQAVIKANYEHINATNAKLIVLLEELEKRSYENKRKAVNN